MTALRTCLGVLALLCLWAVRVSPVAAEDKKLEPVRFWWGLVGEKKLAEMAPPKGYVTGEAEWKKLWEAWRPGEKVPDVDFTKHLVLVHLGGMYPVAHELTVTDRGDLTIRLSPRVPPKPGYGYGIAVIERGSVKTIEGKAIDPD